jgi:hypothetical protein
MKIWTQILLIKKQDSVLFVAWKELFGMNLKKDNVQILVPINLKMH